MAGVAPMRGDRGWHLSGDRDGGSPSDTRLTAEMAMRMRKKEDISNDAGDSRGSPNSEGEGRQSGVLFGSWSWRCLMRHQSGAVSQTVRYMSLGSIWELLAAWWYLTPEDWMRLWRRVCSYGRERGPGLNLWPAQRCPVMTRNKSSHSGTSSSLRIHHVVIITWPHPPWLGNCPEMFFPFRSLSFFPASLSLSFKKKNVYLFLAMLSLHCCSSFSLVVVSGVYSWLRCIGFSLPWLFLLWSSRALGL